MKQQSITRTLSSISLILLALGTPANATARAPARIHARPAAPRIASLPEDGPCIAANVRTATIADLTAPSRRSIGHCVAVEGIAVGRLLVADGAARYRPERIENDPSSNGAILGLDGDQSFAQPTRVRVIGRLRDCAAPAPNAAPLPATAGGYCYYFKGLALTATSVIAGEVTHFTRLRRGEAAPGLGNLVPLAEGDVRRQMMAAARRFVTAVRGGNVAALATMHGGAIGDTAATADSGHRDAAETEAALRLILADETSPFASLRQPTSLLIEIFGWRDPLWADATWQQERARQPAADAIACFSIRPDAGDLWPIDSKDADNRPGRPYACTRIHLAGVGQDAPASFDTAQAANGAAEP